MIIGLMLITKKLLNLFGTINYNNQMEMRFFDHSFIMADTQDRVPTVYIENGNVVNLDPMIQLKSVLEEILRVSRLVLKILNY